MLSPRARRHLENLTKPEFRTATTRYVESRRFSCEFCYNPIFTALELSGGVWTRLNAVPSRHGLFVLVSKGGEFRALALSAKLTPGEFGATAELDTFVKHSLTCGPPAKQWWRDDDRKYLGHHPPSLPEIDVWLRPSELQVGDRVLVAIPPEEEPAPVASPTHVTEIGPGYVVFGQRRRDWDDRARVLVKRVSEGSSWDIFLHACALVALRQAGCRCEIPLVENRRGDRPVCRRCRTDSGFVKGLWRRRGWAGDPHHISEHLKRREDP